MASDPPREADVPISVRLGEVVPPEDPEDWTRPLTWVVAAGLLGPALVTGVATWLTVAAGREPFPLMAVVIGTVMSAGAGLAGATQRGSWRPAAGVVVAAVFAALTVVIVGAESPPPVRAATLWGVVGGLGGALVAAIVLVAGRRTRGNRRLAVGALAGGVAGYVCSSALQWVQAP